MSSLDEISTLTSRLEEMKQKEARANEMNQALQQRIEQLMSESAGHNAEQKDADKLSGSGGRYRESKGGSDSEISFLREALKASARTVDADDEFSSIYFDILQDLKYAFES